MDDNRKKGKYVYDNSSSRMGRSGVHNITSKILQFSTKSKFS